ncbi:MAG: PD40 domain-containing protein [Phycisphaerales bacterium]|nr:MAG: PD40 domain-containing protein [Phycisphaerales bacterium]
MTRMRIPLIIVLALPASLWAWTAPVPLAGVNSNLAEDWAPFPSFDGLSLYFSRVRSDEFYYGRMYEAWRGQPSGPFTIVRQLDELNKPGTHVLCPWVSPDNLRMYYYTEHDREGWKLRVSERPSTSAPWPQGVEISELNVLGSQLQAPKLTPDELTVFFDAYEMPGGQGGYDIWMATRPDIDSPFGSVMNLGEINSGAADTHQFVSTDGLELYFVSDRNGSFQIFRATRDSAHNAFGNVEHLSFLDTPGGHSLFPAPSSDGMAIYFTRETASGRFTRDIYVSYIPEPATIVLLTFGEALLRRKLR